MHANSSSSLAPAHRQQVGIALGRIPSGLFILTAAHEERRMGMLTGFVQQVCFDPPMVSVAIAKGRAVMPLISESRQFGLCQLGENDRIITRKFATASAGTGPGDDPFLGFDLIAGTLPNLPILANALAYLECELTCHMDVEGDHDLFVGTVRGGACKDPKAPPCVHLREDGLNYGKRP